MSFFTKFFDHAIGKKDPKDDSTILPVVKTKPPYYGTVTPYQNFNATNDTAVLKSAIESKGVDEDVITAILVKRSNEQRQKIEAVFESTTGKTLEAALKKALKGDYEDICLGLLMTPAQFDAHQFRKATHGLGTNEDVLVEILATRSNKEILEIKSVFKAEYKKDLEDVIKSETSGDFTKALLAMLKANRDESTVVDVALAQKDAETLFEAGEHRKGTDVNAFIDILTSRSGPQLSKTFQQYATVSKNKLPKALQMELKGDIEKCLIDIVKSAYNTPAFFAERLHLAFKGLGTKEAAVTRVLVSRSEVDLKRIMEEYKAMYSISLHDHIVKETSGHYQKILVGLLGTN